MRIWLENMVGSSMTKIWKFAGAWGWITLSWMRLKGFNHLKWEFHQPISLANLLMVGWNEFMFMIFVLRQYVISHPGLVSAPIQRDIWGDRETRANLLGRIQKLRFVWFAGEPMCLSVVIVDMGLGQHKMTVWFGWCGFIGEKFAVCILAQKLTCHTSPNRTRMWFFDRCTTTHQGWDATNRFENDVFGMFWDGSRIILQQCPFHIET